jgi:hypothetical protein
MLFPIFAGPLLGQSDFVRRRIISVDCEVAVIDFLSAKRLQRRKKKSEKKKPDPAHKIPPLGPRKPAGMPPTVKHGAAVAAS